MTHLVSFQTPLLRGTAKAVLPMCGCIVSFNRVPLPVFPPFLLCEGWRWSEPKEHPALCMLQKWEKKKWFAALTENPKRLISYPIISLFSQLALILSFVRVETTWVFYLVPFFFKVVSKKVCSPQVWMSNITWRLSKRPSIFWLLDGWASLNFPSSALGLKSMGCESVQCCWCLRRLVSGSQASQLAVVKNPLANAGDAGDEGLIPGLGRSPGGGNGNPLQYSCLENPMDRGAWQATVHGVAESRTLSDWAHVSGSHSHHIHELKDEGIR